MIARIQRLTAIPVLAMGLTGCLSKKTPKTPPPPMVQPRSRLPKAEEPRFPAPPVLAESRAPVEELPVASAPPRFPPAPRPVRPQRKRPGIAPGIARPAETVPQPGPPQPQLGELLTAQQQTQLRQLYNQSFARASRILSSLQGKTLTAEQAESASRITALLKQAVDALQRDLGTAAQLAQRADVLARDLQSAIR